MAAPACARIQRLRVWAQVSSSAPLTASSSSRISWGWMISGGEKAMMESLLCFKRAGCDGILTYFAPEVARVLLAD